MPGDLSSGPWLLGCDRGEGWRLSAEPTWFVSDPGPGLATHCNAKKKRFLFADDLALARRPGQGKASGAACGIVLARIWRRGPGRPACVARLRVLALPAHAGKVGRAHARARELWLAGCSRERPGRRFYDSARMTRRTTHHSNTKRSLSSTIGRARLSIGPPPCRGLTDAHTATSTSRMGDAHAGNLARSRVWRALPRDRVRGHRSDEVVRLARMGHIRARLIERALELLLFPHEKVITAAIVMVPPLHFE